MKSPSRNIRRGPHLAAALLVMAAFGAHDHRLAAAAEAAEPASRPNIIVIMADDK